MIHTFTTDEHRWLSNMVYVDIPLKGIIYPSVEHAYQSEKSHDLEWKKTCSDRTITSGQIKRKSKKITIREDWDDVKVLVMYYCLQHKYRQQPFKSKLIATGNENLQEGNFWNDTFWGVNLKVNPNVGENNLGRLIMKIREEIK